MTTKTTTRTFWAQQQPRPRRVYVVCRTNSTTGPGPFAVFADGYMRRESAWRGEWNCNCGNKADTRGHFLSRVEAERAARDLNREEA